MRRIFQDELAKRLPIARDDAPFAEAWAMLCAFRAFAILTWIVPESVQNSDAEWVGEWTARRAVFAAISRLANVAAPIARMEAIADAMNCLTDAIRRKWPEFADAEDMKPHWSALAT